MRSAIALVACVAVLAMVNYSVFEKERQLANGKVVYLELAPVDPRSLMQGDYMALRFKVANDVIPAMARLDSSGSVLRGRDPAAADGRIVATLDSKSIATYRRLDDGTPLAPDEILLRYRVREGQVKFATTAFFFQEGTSQRYEQARYGEFRVAADGGLLLFGLRGKELQAL